MFGCSCYFVVECYGVFSVGGGALLDRPCMLFQIMCVLCLCVSKCSFYMFCLCLSMSEVFSSFKSLRAGSPQVFALLMLFLFFGIICGRVRACS